MHTAVAGGSNPTNQQLTISANGAFLNYSITDNANWLTATGSDFITPDNVTVSVNIGTMPAGEYQARITFTSFPLPPVDVMVRLTLTNGGGTPMLSNWAKYAGPGAEKDAEKVAAFQATQTTPPLAAPTRKTATTGLT